MEISIGQILDELAEASLKSKENAKTSDEARHWAIFRTELEKVSAYYKTYLSESGKIVEGGSE